MLRYIYLFTLFLFINNIYSLQYASDVDSNDGLYNKKSKLNTRLRGKREQNYNKRQDYEMEDESDSGAQIDVAGFIQSPDNSFEEDQFYQLENDR